MMLATTVMAILATDQGRSPCTSPVEPLIRKR